MSFKREKGRGCEIPDRRCVFNVIFVVLCGFVSFFRGYGGVGDVFGGFGTCGCWYEEGI